MCVHTHTLLLFPRASPGYHLSTRGRIQVAPLYEVFSGALPHARSKAGLTP